MSDVWFRSVEDLLTALDTGNTGAASATFAINLQTSAVPLELGLKASLQFEGLHVYRLLHRLNNGLPQFQLRLGIIGSDLEADAILATLRPHYPGATKKLVGDADRTAIARMVGSARRRSTLSSRYPVRDPVRDPVPRVPPKDAAVAPKLQGKSVTEDLQWNIDEVLRRLVGPMPTPPAVSTTPTVVPSPPAPLAVSPTPVPPEVTSTPAPPVVSSTPVPPAPAVTALRRPDPVPGARAVTGSPPQVVQTTLPEIDSTRTVRALTSFELVEDAEVSRWFVLQLMHSQEQIDPEQVPNLDIFSEYRLYAVGETNQEGAGYALRLGFFSSEVAAAAVAGYLAPHFPTTSIKRISLAEHDRFAQNVLVAKKDVGLAGSHVVIEFSAPRSLPEAPAVPAENAAPIDGNRPSPQAAASLWSRLTSRRVPR